jgi:hypothetical protein
VLQLSNPVPATIAQAEQIDQVEQIVVVDFGGGAITDYIANSARRNGISPTLALAIARCESGYRQFEADGVTALRGRLTPDDIGVFQINEYYHLANSRRLGYNIHTLEGNVGYAMWLLQTQGSQPWFWSKHCWQALV